MSYQMGWNHPGAPNNFGGQFRPPGFGMQGGRGGPMQQGNFRGHPNGFGFGNNGFARGGPSGPRMGFGPDNGFGNFNGPPMGQMGPPNMGMNTGAFDEEYDYDEEEGNLEGPKSDGFGPQSGGRPLQPPEILSWLDAQDSTAVRRVMFHCRWLLEQRGEQLENIGFGDNGENGRVKTESESAGGKETATKDDSGEPDSSWYTGATPGLSPTTPAVAGAPPMAPEGTQPFAGAPFRGRGGPMPGYNNVGPRMPMGPPNKMMRPNFGGPRPPFGYQGGPPGRGGFGPPVRPGQMQWTPSGWVQKDNTHKVTSTIKPLPAPDIIPPNSIEHSEATADRSKLKMLENNVNMMNYELEKICRKYQINRNQLTAEDVTKHPEEVQNRLKTALGCVKAAEKTLDDFKEYLKEDKYKSYNDEQKQRAAEAIKTMIGEMPQGKPHKKPEVNENQHSDSDQLAADEKQGV